MFFVTIKMVVRVLVSAFELLYGVIRLRFLRRDMITVFGGHKVATEDRYGKAAHKISYEMVKAGYGIFTGGGSGVMREAQRGACKAKRELNISETVSVGIIVRHLKEGRSDDYADYFLSVCTFYVRKWLLMRFSMEFLILPGSFGTLDEFMELVTLLKTEAMEKRKIILFGKDYWSGFLDWFTEQGVGKGFGDASELKLFKVVDSVDEAIEALKKCCADVKR